MMHPIPFPQNIYSQLLIGFLVLEYYGPWPSMLSLALQIPNIHIVSQMRLLCSAHNIFIFSIGREKSRRPLVAQRIV